MLWDRDCGDWFGDEELRDWALACPWDWELLWLEDCELELEADGMLDELLELLDCDGIPAELLELLPAA